MAFFNSNKYRQEQEERVYYPLFILWLFMLAGFFISVCIGLTLHYANIVKFSDGLIIGWIICLFLFVVSKASQKIIKILPSSFKETWGIRKYEKNERAARVKAEIYSLQGFISCVFLLGTLGLGLAMFSFDCIGSQLYTHPSAFIDELRKNACKAGIKPALILGSVFGLFMWAFALINTIKNKILSNILFLLLLILVSLDFLGYPFLEPIMMKLFN